MCVCVYMCTCPTPVCTIFRPVSDSRKLFSETVGLKIKPTLYRWILFSKKKHTSVKTVWRRSARLSLTGFSSHLRRCHVVFILADTERQRRTHHTGNAKSQTHTHCLCEYNTCSSLRHWHARWRCYLMLMKLLVVRCILSARSSNSFTPSYKLRGL